MVCSPARLAANRANAAKSTGPKTPEGKAAARGNALKHGLTGAGVVLPPELAEELDRRTAAWGAHVRPTDPIEARMVRQAALATIRIDRLAAQEFALVAANRRRDLALWDDDRTCAAEALGRRLADDPAAVVPDLRRTAHGCDWLADRWRALAGGLDDGRCAWTDADAALALDLLGLPPSLRHLDPAARAVAAQVERARRGGPGADAATDALRTLADEQIADLEEQAGWLREEVEAHDRAALEQGLRFDVSPDVLRLRRYESASTQAFWKALRWIERYRAGEALPEPPAGPSHLPDLADPDLGADPEAGALHARLRATLDAIEAGPADSPESVEADPRPRRAPRDTPARSADDRDSGGAGGDPPRERADAPAATALAGTAGAAAAGGAVVARPGHPGAGRPAPAQPADWLADLDAAAPAPGFLAPRPIDWSEPRPAAPLPFSATPRTATPRR